MAKKSETDKVVERVGKVTIFTRGTTANLWIRYPMTKEKRTKVVRKSTQTADLSTAKAFARKIDRELVEANGIELPKVDSKPVTLLEAALSHPSSKRDREVYPVQFRLYESYIDQFSWHTGVWLLKSLTVESVLSWVEKLRTDGFKPATISHRLRYIRRASRMAPSHFLPDVLSGLQLNRNDEYVEDIRVFSEQELAAIIAALEKSEDWRGLCSVGLMGLMGLRPTEVLRLQIADTRDGVLRVGVRKRKNRSSRRDLPMPQSLQSWITLLSQGRDPLEPLVYSGHYGMKGKPWAITSLNHYLNPRIEEAAGRRLPCKHFRKTFASLAVGPIGLDVRTVETFLGHSFSLAAPVSTRHYLAKQAVKELLPAARQIDEWWTALYQSFTSGNGDSLAGGTPTGALSEGISLDLSDV